MISITSKSPYAVLALAELGRSAGAGPVPIGELARKRDVPVQFLEQLFAALRRAGVISSQRGVKGGYRHGATDDYGFEAVEGKVHVHDWHATVLHLLGLNHEKLTYQHAGREMRLTDVKGNVVKAIVG